MATVATLMVNLTARTAAFNKNMKKSAEAVKTFAVKSAAALKVLGGAFKAAGVAAIGFGFLLARSVKRMFTSIDATAKLSKRLGIATEDLTALRHAAGLSGVGITSLDLAIQRMIRRVGEAAAGTGEAKAALKELGLDAKKMKLEGPAKSLDMIADALMAVTNQGDRVRLAFKLFDTEGVSMVQMLQGGSSELHKMTNEARELGLAFSSLEASRVEELNDDITRLKAVLEGVIIRLAVDLAPMLEFATELFVDWAKAGNFGSKSIGKSIKELIKPFMLLIKIGKFMLAIFKGIVGTVGLIIGAVTGAIGVVLKLVAAVAKFLGAEGIGKSIKEMGDFALDFAGEAAKKSLELGEGIGVDLGYQAPSKKDAFNFAKEFAAFESKRVAREKGPAKKTISDLGGAIGEAIGGAAQRFRGGGFMAVAAGAVDVGALGSTLANKMANQNLKANQQTATATSRISEQMARMVLE